MPTQNQESNRRVLGILIKRERLEQGYSLRELAKETNISHTLISNIENGKQIANEATLEDIFKALDLEFYDNSELQIDFMQYYEEILKYLLGYEYQKAQKLTDEIEIFEDRLIRSYFAIDYFLIKTLSRTLIKTINSEVTDIINTYEDLIELFSPKQKQLFYFVSGLDYLNRERYVNASSKMMKALQIGDRNLDVFIKEYLVRAFIRQYKFTDTMAIAQEAVQEFERRTEYLRAMRVRLTIIRIYLHIMKLDKVDEMLTYVESFASKMNIVSLIDHCMFLRSKASFQKKHYKDSEYYLNQHSNQQNPWLILPRFRTLTMLKDEKVHTFYKDIIENKSTEITLKTLLLIKVLYQHHFKDDSTEEYLSDLEALTEEAVQSMDQELITLSYNLQIVFYKQARKYKKALDVVDKFLHLKKLYI